MKIQPPNATSSNPPAHLSPSQQISPSRSRDNFSDYLDNLDNIDISDELVEECQDLDFGDHIDEITLDECDEAIVDSLSSTPFVEAPSSLNTMTMPEGIHPERMASSELSAIAAKIVQSMQIGKNAKGHNIAFLEVAIPGRGNIHIQIAQNGRAASLKLSAETQDMTRILYACRGDLYRSGRDNGVLFSAIHIAPHSR